MKYSSGVLALHPVAYYRLDDTSTALLSDSSGNGRNGSYVAPVTLGAPPVINGDTDAAVRFTNQGYGNVPSNPPVVSDIFSLELWLVQTASQTTQGLLNMGASAGQLQLQNGQVQCFIATAGAVLSSTITLNVGQPYHIVFTKNGATSANCYVNGVDVSGAITNRTGLAASQVQIGANFAGNHCAGIIDEVAIYDYVLTPAQVSVNYQNGVAPAPVFAAWRNLGQPGASIRERQLQCWAAIATGQRVGP